MGRVLSTLVTTLVVLVAVAVVTVVAILPRATGGATLAVLSGSMEPTYPTGSAIVIRPVEDPTSLQVGDVITFQAAPGVQQLITHRIIERQPDTTPPSYRTQGDANAAPDITPVPIGAIRGQVWFHVPYLGSLTAGMSGPRGLMVVGIVLLLGVIVDRLNAIRRALLDDESTDAPTDAPSEADAPAPTLATTALPESVAFPAASAEASPPAPASAEAIVPAAGA